MKRSHILWMALAAILLFFLSWPSKQSTNIGCSKEDPIIIDPQCRMQDPDDLVRPAMLVVQKDNLIQPMVAFVDAEDRMAPANWFERLGDRVSLVSPYKHRLLICVVTDAKGTSYHITWDQPDTSNQWFAFLSTQSWPLELERLVDPDPVMTIKNIFPRICIHVGSANEWERDLPRQIGGIRVSSTYYIFSS